MNEAKIMLSEDELTLAQNAGWLLTKNVIIEKIYILFGYMAEEMQQLRMGLPASFPPDIFLTSAKIARGENYRGLPYVMLDYPRCFSRSDIFAIRTMFWWGNFFSVTLHLKGKYKSFFMPGLKKNIEKLASLGFFIALDEDEWRHDLSPEHYKKMSSMDALTTERILEEKDYCKLAVSIPLDQWNQLNVQLPVYYRELLNAIRP